MQNNVIGDKELKALYNTHITKAKATKDDKWEKKFYNANYRFWGFIVYPIFKNTRLLALVKAIMARILVRTRFEYYDVPLKPSAALKNISLIVSAPTSITASSQVQTQVLNQVKEVIKKVEVKVEKGKADGVKTVQMLDSVSLNVLKNFTIDHKNKINKLAIKVLARIVCDELSSDERDEIRKLVQRKNFSTKVNNTLEQLLDEETLNSNGPTDLSSFHDNEDSQNGAKLGALKAKLMGNKNIVQQLNEILVSGQSKVAKRTDIVENGSETAESETLDHLQEVIQDVERIFTQFVPKQRIAPTAPSGKEATDAQYIKKLDNLRISVEKYIKSGRMIYKKGDALTAIDKAIVNIVKSALGNPERKELFLMARKGELSKNTRYILSPVLFKQYQFQKGGSTWNNYPVALNLQAFNSLRTTEEICNDVLNEIDNRLQTEQNPDQITLLTNIQARYKKHLATLQVDAKSMANSSEKGKAYRILKYHAFAEKIKGKNGEDLLKEAMSTKDYKAYQRGLISKKKKVELSSLIDAEGVDWYNLFKDLTITINPDTGRCDEFDTISGVCDQLGLVIQQSGLLSPQDLEALRQEIMKRIFEKYYQSKEYVAASQKSSGKQLRLFYEKFGPKGFSKWMKKKDSVRKLDVEKAEKVLSTSYEVKIPEWHHCTPTSTAFLSICKTNVKPSHAPLGSGAFASNTIEMPSYGNWGFAFDLSSVVGNVPVNVFAKSHGAFWSGFSDALKVPIMDTGGTITGLDVAYVIVNDKDYNNQEEDQNSPFNQSAFSVQQSGGDDISDHEKQTVKGVRKMLAKEGIQGVTVVTLDEAMLEKDLLFGNVCQTPIWEPGYGAEVFTDNDDYRPAPNNSRHPTLYDINRQKYPGNLRVY